MGTKEIIVSTPTKINIALYVTGRRENGYHDLLMLNERLDLSDDVAIKATEGKSGITITCDNKDVPCDERNICHKAVRLLAETFPERFEGLGIEIDIKKRIPVAGGLGGGSSDAAAVLRGLNNVIGLNLSLEKLAGIGVRLGADVPFFLYDGPAICEGIGEDVTTLSPLPKMWILLINPNFPVATKWVYEEFDKMVDLQLTQENQSVRGLPLPAKALVAGRNFKELGELIKVVHNDLELVTAAKFPEIKNIEKSLVDNGAIFSWMSGSGPTVIGLFESKDKRDAAKKKLDGGSWRVVATENIV